MATKLDFAFRRLETLVAKYCLPDKADEAREAVTWAWEYAHDYPEEPDIQEAIRLIKQAENCLTEEGKPLYAEVRAEVATRLRHLLSDKKRKVERKKNTEAPLEE